MINDNENILDSILSIVPAEKMHILDSYDEYSTSIILDLDIKYVLSIFEYPRHLEWFVFKYDNMYELSEDEIYMLYANINLLSKI